MSNPARILVVDDERSIRELLEIFLRKEGYEVQKAQSVTEALDLIKSTEFDLIVSDIRMPEMSGIDLLRHVRSNNFNGQFILLTAFASADAAIQALKMGAFDYILKT
jgi:two-component system response regulator PilR (NtrC family)